jgi:hypothetical protein
VGDEQRLTPDEQIRLARDQFDSGQDFTLAVEEELARPLRLGEPPVVGVVRDGRLLLDCRTLTDAEAEEVAAAVVAARG